MDSSLKDISQISLYMQEELAERVNEIALFQPLARKSPFDEESKTYQKRKWTFDLPLHQRLWRKIQTFFYQKLSFFVPSERRTPEAKFKTVVAILLAQETLREFFLGNEKRQKSFFQALAKAAETIGYTEFSSPEERDPLEISRELTSLGELCLIDDLSELSMQMAMMTRAERNALLYAILDTAWRPPLTSVLEVSQGESIAHNIAVTTCYGKIHLQGVDPQTGKVSFTAMRDQATSSIRTLDNTKPGAKGAMNQRVAYDGEILIGSYCGELTTEAHVLEQILFLLDGKEPCFLFEETPHTSVEKQTILFTSLFSWNELDAIQAQSSAIEELHGKILKINDRHLRLNLIHRNIPFNALNKLPMPSETGAQIQDLNSLSLIYFTTWVLPEDPFIQTLFLNVEKARAEGDFLKRRTQVLAQIDRFKEQKKEWIAMLAKRSDLGAQILHTLMSKKLRGIDELIYTSLLMKILEVRENKNCYDSTDRSAGANAADKAQHAYTKIYKKPFLPLQANEEETALFKVLYSMYLVWEEPELTAGLSTGFVGEKFHHNFLQKNPETTHYLVKWLKRHPEIYLGLSDYRR